MMPDDLHQNSTQKQGGGVLGSFLGALKAGHNKMACKMA
jgi:hypothetical protein